MIAAICILGVVAGAGALYALHRLGLWLESRGYIYYRGASGSTALGNAMQEMQRLVDRRGKQVVQEEKRISSRATPGAPPPDTGHQPRSKLSARQPSDASDAAGDSEGREE